MPFGICSVPEVFQCRMYELIEGLQGIEVADNLLQLGLEILSIKPFVTMI